MIESSLLQMLSPVERDVLVDLLTHGDNVPGNIADNTDRHPKSVSKRLKSLEEKELIENKGRGVYTLTMDGIAVARRLNM